MNKKYKNWIIIPLLMFFIHGGAGELAAQANRAAQQKAKGEDALKKLILEKFDVNLDNNLSTPEQAKAVAFLKSIDKNGDGQISLSERTMAMGVLKRMGDTAQVARTEKMTLASRSDAKRTTSWGEFVKSLPHGGGSRNFTKMPGSPGFDIKGEKDVNLTAESRRGPTPNSDSKKSAKEFKLAMEGRKKALELERKRANYSPPKEAPKAALEAVKKAGNKNYYDGTVILVSGGNHTVVPQGAILNMPPNMTKMISKEPKGELLIWPKFLKKNARFVMTREVSWETAKGEKPITKEEKKVITMGRKIVVAVFHKNPVSVAEPIDEAETEKVVGGTVVPSNNK